MSTIQKVAFNTLSQSIGKIIFLIISLVITAILTRYLGPRVYGFYALITVYLALATRFYDFGISSIGSREIAKHPTKAPQILSNVFSLRLVFGILTFLAVILISFLTYRGDEFLILRNAIFIAAFTIIVNNLTSSWITIFLAKLKMGYAAFAEAVNRFAVLIGILIAVKLNLGFLVIISIVVFGNLIYFLLVSLFAKNLFRIKIFLARDQWRKLWKDSWPLGLYLIAGLLLFRIDSILISYLRPPEEVGYYGAAFKVLEVVFNFAVFFSVSVFPIIVYRIQINDQEGIQRILRRSLSFILFISLPIILVIFFLAKEIINLIAGSEFLVAVPALKILTLAVAFGFFNVLFGYLMTAKNKQNIALNIAVFGLILNIILNIIFIPQYGFIAAAYTTLLAQFIEFILSGFFMIKFYSASIDLKNTSKILIIALLTGIFIFSFNSLDIVLYRVGIAFLGSFLYFTILIFWNKEFKEIFLKFFKKPKT